MATLVRWHVVLVRGLEERHMYVRAPKGCDIDAVEAAKAQWREEFGPASDDPDVVSVKEVEQA